MGHNGLREIEEVFVKADNGSNSYVDTAWARRFLPSLSAKRKVQLFFLSSGPTHVRVGGVKNCSTMSALSILEAHRTRPRQRLVQARRYCPGGLATEVETKYYSRPRITGALVVPRKVIMREWFVQMHNPKCLCSLVIIMTCQ